MQQKGEAMQYRKLGASDLNVSEICLGTMTFGNQNSEAEALPSAPAFSCASGPRRH